MTTTCLLAWAAALLLLPFIVLLWLAETPDATIRRWHRQGMSQRAIAQRLGITRWKVRMALAAV